MSVCDLKLMNIVYSEACSTIPCVPRMRKRHVSILNIWRGVSKDELFIQVYIYTRDVRMINQFLTKKTGVLDWKDDSTVRIVGGQSSQSFDHLVKLKLRVDAV